MKAYDKMMKIDIQTFADLQASIPYIQNFCTVLLILDSNFSSTNYQKLSCFLTSCQKKKIKKYWKLGDQYNYAATHAVVNIIFSKLENRKICDADIQFDQGKPFIENSRNIKYNISHTAQCAVVAFAHKEIGVDIENYNHKIEYQSILHRYFRYESNVYQNIDLQTFYTLWTIKEAYSKFSKRGIKDIENIDIVSYNHTKACVQDTYTHKCFEVAILYVQKMFVVSMCFGKQKSIQKGDVHNV